MAQDSNHVRKSLNIKPNASPDLSQTGDIGVDSADSNRLKYNPGTGAERIALQQDITAEATARSDADIALTASIATTQADIDAHELNTSNPHATTKTQVGLGNVDNTSDATKDAAVATLTNKTLTAPVINSPTGIVKGDVGLGNVDNTSDATKNAAVATLTNKTLTAPAITAPTGIVKGDVGLGNVDNTSDATKNAAVATLTNKTLTTPITDIITVVNQSSTPSSPSAGSSKLYAKTNGKVYKLTSAGTESEIGSGGGGSKNYFSLNSVNGDFEANTTSPWLKAQATFVSGTPTAGTLTFNGGNYSIAVNSSAPLSGIYDMLVTKPASNCQGMGFASAIMTIEKEDVGKVLYGSFSYLCSSTNFDASGTSTQSMEIWIADPDSGAFIQPSGYRGMNQNVGPGKVAFSFQPPTTQTRFVVCVFTAQTSALAYTVQVDNFVVGPQAILTGAVVTDWQDYTPTIVGAGTTTLGFAKWKRVGDSIAITTRFQTGTPTGVTATFSLPPGLTTNLTTQGPVGILIGQSSAPLAAVSVLATLSSSNLTFGVQGTGLGSNVGTSLFGTSVLVGFTTELIPVTGWSSNTQMSSDSDGRVTAVRATGTSTGSLTTTLTTIPFNSVLTDTHGSYNVNGTFTAQSNGVYDFSVSAKANGTFGAASTMYLELYNVTTSSVISGTSILIFNATSNGQHISLQVPSVSLNAGSQVVARIQYGGTITTPTLESGTGTFFAIRKQSGSAIALATDSINARYDALGSTTATINGVLKFTTKNYDSHGSYSASTGLYTAPVSGKYRVTISGLYFSAGSADIALFKNGSNDSTIGSTSTGRASFTGWVNLNAGETVGIHTLQAATIGDITALGIHAYFERTGN